MSGKRTQSRIERRPYLHLAALAGTLLALSCQSGGRQPLSCPARPIPYPNQSAPLDAMRPEATFADPEACALALAASRGRTDEIDRLIARGVDPNARGAGGATPLLFAYLRKNKQGFDRLLELGADPDVVFEGNSTILHTAALHSELEFLESALAHGDPNLVVGPFGETPIFAAAFSREAVELLLDAGADPDWRDSNGGTPAMAAAGLGRFDVTYLLLERGADYCAVNERGFDLIDRLNLQRPVTDPDQARWREKVVAWLRERGVEPRRGRRDFPLNRGSESACSSTPVRSSQTSGSDQ